MAALDLTHKTLFETKEGFESLLSIVSNDILITIMIAIPVAGRPTEHAQAIKARQTYDNIDYPAKQRLHAAEKRGYKVQLKQSDKPPVDSPNDDESKGSPIQWP